MQDQILQTIQLFKSTLAEDLLAVYLYGSSVDGGLKPQSDVDLLVIINRDLQNAERHSLAQKLLDISVPIGRLDGRALEITVLNSPKITAQIYPFSYEMQWGEWLRAELVQGLTLESSEDPDIAILLKKVQLHHHVLLGEHPSVYLPIVTDEQLERAIGDTYPQIVAHWDEDGDELNQVLALCRMCYTLQYKEIVPKDVAAQWFISSLQQEDVNNQSKHALQLMIKEYIGQTEPQNWTLFHAELDALVKVLSKRLDQYFSEQPS
ncbi:DUF4111 domain-containing protein [Acinetobacter junii]|uniref:aminoglycoside adenylyltransferase domain-containing protein n=1 Tax=Acinetobacter junii TaxID=40215 RepID=UPI000B3CBDCF|nr:aminoglycoside adenylyltransferase domain-containing protein [Acinetobacter junii]AWA48502.1 DUF4111 domain-containing protein [Acinetobacter junii]